MTDIVERLRAECPNTIRTDCTRCEAADEIERLRTDKGNLAGLLSRLLDNAQFFPDDVIQGEGSIDFQDWEEEARSALNIKSPSEG